MEHRAPPAHGVSTEPTEALARQYAAVRAASEALCAPLEVEDHCVQPMADASPPKWHLAHTTWFFETFLLEPYLGSAYRPFHPAYAVLFNSYYNGVGEQFPRPRRGHLSRPTVREVLAYRAHVDAAMGELLRERDDPQLRQRVVVGLHHEQQHQELLLTDVKANFGANPLRPAYAAAPPTGIAPDDGPGAPGFTRHDGGLLDVGTDGGAATRYEDFVFDNETPRHRVWVEPFEIADRLVTSGEWLEFMESGAYEEPALWLSDGWTEVQRRTWRAPAYWFADPADGWSEYTLAGPRPVDRDAPVTHVSFYEADAFARWAGLRLPTEAEWEHAAASPGPGGAFVEDGALHPRPAPAGPGPRQFFGDAWEWTASSYGPYPGFEPFPGALGEYNGKFMSNQLVLRGGSCATPRDHVRRTYRNFFYPPDRWQFTGVRLARGARS